jgi:hypothetical protein
MWSRWSASAGAKPLPFWVTQFLTGRQSGFVELREPDLLTVEHDPCHRIRFSQPLEERIRIRLV